MSEKRLAARLFPSRMLRRLDLPYGSSLRSPSGGGGHPLRCSTSGPHYGGPGTQGRTPGASSVSVPRDRPARLGAAAGTADPHGQDGRPPGCAGHGQAAGSALDRGSAGSQTGWRAQVPAGAGRRRGSTQPWSSSANLRCRRCRRYHPDRAPVRSRSRPSSRRPRPELRSM